MTAATGGSEETRLGGFRRSEIGIGGDEQTARLAWLLDVQGRQPGVTRLRDWAFDRLDLRAGETVLDVGSGTGAVVVRLAETVGPTGSVIGVEPNSAMRDLARTRAGDAPGIDFVDGGAEALPVVDGSVDAVICERVLQHLEDPAAAVAEMARVLRPGGRVALLDSDFGTSILHPADREVGERYERGMLALWPNPYSGRRLRSLLREAGLDVEPDVGSSALVVPEEMLPGLLATQGAALVEAGVVTADEVSALNREVEAASGHGDAFVSVTMFAAIGRRPE